MGAAVGTGGAGIAIIERPHMPQNRLSTEFSAPHDAHRKMFSPIAVHFDVRTGHRERLSMPAKSIQTPFTLAKIAPDAPVSLVAVPSVGNIVPAGETR